MMVARGPETETQTAQRRLAAALAFASQLAHLWILPGEFSARPLVGAFVFLAAVFQGLLAASMLFDPSRWTVRLGILLNAILVLVWVVTRFWGFSAAFGFTRLPVEPLGLAATAAEVALIALLIGIGRNLKAKRKKWAKQTSFTKRKPEER